MDLAWSHLLGMGGAMSNPFEYREIMKASMRFNETRTVDQVVAEHEARHKERSDSRTPRARGRGSTKAPVREPTKPTQGQMNALQALQDRARALREARGA